MKADNKYILTIDLGTSGPKVALISVYGKVVDNEFNATPIILLAGGGAEQDPEGWWNAIMSASKRLLAKKLVPVDDIIAVSVTTQWSGTVPVDKEGNHLMNAIIWMDCRGHDSMDHFLKSPIKISGYPLVRLIQWLKISGGGPALSGKDSLSHILWLKKDCSDIYKKTYKFLEPKDYINLRLTGKFAATYDSILLHWVTDNVIHPM
jgi:xylulokinase